MLHILFIILKILGILLLVILGLLLAVVLAVLFAPIGYRGDGYYHGLKEYAVHLHIHWLLHIVSLRIAYENELQYAFRLFGIRLFGSESEKTEKRGSAEVNEDSELEALLSDRAPDSANLETVQMQERAGEFQASPETERSSDELIERAEETSKKTDDAIEKAEETARLLEEAVRRRAEANQESPACPEKEDQAEDSFSEEDSEKDPKISFFQRITTWMKQKFYALRQAFSSLITRIRALEHKRQAIAAFIENEENQASFRRIKRQLMRILRHVFPRKLSGQVTFGVEDPYLMGQILTAAAFLYPFYGKQMELMPVMDTDTLNGELSFRGRAQIGVILLRLLWIWMDKNVRTQVHKYRNRGGR